MIARILTIAAAPIMLAACGAERSGPSSPDAQPVLPPQAVVMQATAVGQADEVCMPRGDGYRHNERNGALMVKMTLHCDTERQEPVERPSYPPLP
jgi:hypothetical protein